MTSILQYWKEYKDASMIKPVNHWSLPDSSYHEYNLGKFGQTLNVTALPGLFPIRHTRISAVALTSTLENWLDIWRDYKSIVTYAVWQPNTISARGKVFQLAQPILTRIKKQKDIYIAEYKPLDIIVYGRSENEVIEEFNNEFSLLWDCIVCENDENLTEDAQALKKKLSDMVKGIQIEA